MGFLINAGIEAGIAVGIINDLGFSILKDPAANPLMGRKTNLVGFKIRGNP
ncbi:conserved hypothetical protein [delta proteobacterium NaphS2]|nr:conserved hypothetical protein [delta proteobacterium NaphS2]